MSADHQNFEPLRRLLAWKRHEQPPPGYFNDFSQQVIARIRTGDVGETTPLEKWFWRTPWLQQLWTAFETRPVLAGAFGVLVCALLIAGIMFSEKLAATPVAFSPMPEPQVATAQPDQFGERLVLDSQFSSTNGSIPQQSLNALFDGIRIPQKQLVNFSGSGN